MAKYLLMGVSNAAEGRDSDYSDWYADTHMPDICALPGVMSGRRFEATPFGLTPTPGKFLAIYEVESDDIASVMKEMQRRFAAGEINTTASIDMNSTQLWIYAQTGSMEPAS